MDESWISLSFFDILTNCCGSVTFSEMSHLDIKNGSGEK